MGAFFIEMYRGYEIHADMCGYGYLANLPNYDGEPCIYDWTLDGIRREIDFIFD